MGNTNCTYFILCHISALAKTDTNVCISPWSSRFTHTLWEITTGRLSELWGLSVSGYIFVASCLLALQWADPSSPVSQNKTRYELFQRHSRLVRHLKHYFSQRDFSLNVLRLLPSGENIFWFEAGSSEPG